MKRAVITLVAVMSLAAGAGVAQADGPGHWEDGGGGGPSSSGVVAVAGTITSVSSTATTFNADAFLPMGEGDGWHHWPGGGTGAGDQGSGGSGGSGGGQGNFHRDWMGAQPWSAPALTPVTITTNGSTTFRVDDQDATFADLAPGQRFVALFNGAPGDSLQTLVAGPALAVYAHAPEQARQLYAFVGTVSGVDTALGTITVQVSNTVPSGLVPAGSNPATFIVSDSTMVLGGSTVNGLYGGSLGSVATGDIVAGGLLATAGETLSQVESTPLQVLVDFPASAAPMTKSSMRRQARRRALTQALALFGYKNRRRSTQRSHKARHGKAHARRHGGRAHVRRHARRK